MAADGTGVVLIGFGEPEGAELADIESFLEQIFLAGAGLEPGVQGGPAARARTLASARAPQLAETYRSIGGSPLVPQLKEQAGLLESELSRRGLPIEVTPATQFYRPSLSDAVDWARDRGLGRLVVVTTYPVCGPSTTLAALDSLADDVQQRAADLGLTCVTGWHRHPAFSGMWAAHASELMRERGLSLDGSGTLLYFSAHGTPVKYLEAVPYPRYVEEACAAVAEALGAERYALGYQNHGNRPVQWVEPDNESLLPTLEAQRLVVVPISFTHEQSETLGELDDELAAVASGCGLAFHRVPVPHADPALIGIFADLVEAALGHDAATALSPCACRNGAAWCTHGDGGGPK